MPASGRSGGSSRGGAALWIGAIVLAAAATAVLVLSEDARVLKLGLVAALWAALFGALAVAKLRAHLAAADRKAAERQRIYELELEREIAARREHEAEAEAEARRQAAADSGAEIQALKAELRALRENLEQVIGGDVLFERVALRAESTRVRSLAEQDGTGAQPRVISAGGERRPAGVQGQLEPEPAEPPQHRPRRPRSRPPRGTPQGSWPPVQVQQPAHVTPPPVSERHTGEIPAVDDTQPEPPQPEPAPAAEDAGAHTEGTSVIDLLNAYGTATDTQRRRRRRD